VKRPAPRRQRQLFLVSFLTESGERRMVLSDAPGDFLHFIPERIIAITRL
jgi:hypothetical protein